MKAPPTRISTRALWSAGLMAGFMSGLLSGCTSMSGLGGDSKYACKAPDGVTCDSVSGTYANALANNLPSQRQHRAARSARVVQVAQAAQKAQPAALPLRGGPAADGLSTRDGQEFLDTGAALRSPPLFLRLWVKPWEDIDGDLYDQAHIYVQIDQGRWQLDHLQRRIRQAYAPLRPPLMTGRPAATVDGGPRDEALPAAARPAPPFPDLGARPSTEAPR